MFQEARIPLWERRTWPVVTGAGRILWSRSFGPASDVAADSSSGVVLRISERNLRVPESTGPFSTSL
jgi:hypothetical protein